MRANIAADLASKWIQLVGGSIQPSTGGGFCYETSRIAQGNTLTVEGYDVRVSMRLERPEVVLFDNLLTPDECEQLIALARSKQVPSTIVDPKTGEQEVIEQRTSQSAYFQRAEDPLVDRLERRIALLTSLPVEHGEGIQVLHYQQGGEYRPHFDYFPLQDSGSQRHLARGGQRVVTVIMYLNQVVDGGETTFPDVGLSVKPKQGAALYFAYCNSRNQLDPATLHAGAPVLAGEKWIATKWIRQNPYL